MTRLGFLAEHSTWFTATKSRSPGVRLRKKEGQGVVGRTSVWSQAGVLPVPTGPAPSWLGLSLTAFHGVSPMHTQRVGQGDSSFSFPVPRFQG